jgi:hypothetical protein
VAAAEASRKEASAVAPAAGEVTKRVAITAVAAAVATTGIINLINQYIFVFLKSFPATERIFLLHPFAVDRLK